jgi:splicing factor 3A subunit 1
MAPSATNGDAIAVLEEIKAPPGVVLPPKEIKGAPNGLPQVQKD